MLFRSEETGVFNNPLYPEEANSGGDLKMAETLEQLTAPKFDQHMGSITFPTLEDGKKFEGPCRKLDRLDKLCMNNPIP